MASPSAIPSNAGDNGALPDSTLDDGELIPDFDFSDMPSTQLTTAELNAKFDASMQEADEVRELEQREPTRKDISLREFLGKMDEYAPIVRLSHLSVPRRNPSLPLLSSIPQKGLFPPPTKSTDPCNSGTNELTFSLLSQRSPTQ